VKTNEYLYGSGVIVPEIPTEVIEGRIKLLDTQLRELQAVHYLLRNRTRVREIIEAMNFWRNIDSR